MIKATSWRGKRKREAAPSRCAARHRRLCRLTVCPEDQSRRRAVNFALRDAVHHHAGVVAHIGGLHLGDVEVPRLLRHETPVVLLDKVRVLVENPCIREVCRTNEEADVIQGEDYTLGQPNTSLNADSSAG